MKLNPSKCSFGFKEGKFLGHLVSKQDIKANPDKVRAIQEMRSPKTKKEVQSLNGRLAALHRFLSKSAERSLPFFKTLKGCLQKKDFEWSEEAEQAFKALKEYISSIPAVVAPLPDEKLFLYLAIGREAVSTAMVVERGGCQLPVYFITYALRLNFKSTNNEAEYEALLAGLRAALTMKVEHLTVYVDSLLVANQVNGQYEAKECTMQQYLAKDRFLKQ
ncbi:hypothetical protein QVD17_16458 [Tagetes erecta]|uniref:RNase H type-1 domain-containing protein n=1 Tax=Tagetes erecta TaxID=13708 RepID=A0AAD8KS81_TARER|nr:hypothetical protein QVD17_16458 [Tagetes erecta]